MPRNRIGQHRGKYRDTTSRTLGPLYIEYNDRIVIVRVIVHGALDAYLARCVAPRCVASTHISWKCSKLAGTQKLPTVYRCMVFEYPDICLVKSRVVC